MNSGNKEAIAEMLTIIINEDNPNDYTKFVPEWLEYLDEDYPEYKENADLVWISCFEKLHTMLDQLIHVQEAILEILQIKEHKKVLTHDEVVEIMRDFDNINKESKNSFFCEEGKNSFFCEERKNSFF